MDQIAKFMGHTQKTHLEFYSLSEDVYQTAKVAKVLLLLNAGKEKELKGKNLEDIQINEDVINSHEENEEGSKKQELQKKHRRET
ncbi:hypothetical protein FQA39_LY18355 [Lamprigera yunnana]|nr:hypothetical protein FQA39_LY18355 [Lamprigera yunnana]